LPKKYDILGIGSPILDAVIEVSDCELTRILKDTEVGGMVAVTGEEQEAIINSTASPVSYSIGGSANNTVSAIARLGLKAALLGKIGADKNGEFFAEKSKEISLITDMLKVDSDKKSTACCLCLISPNGERTMRTHLGAAQNISTSDINFDELKNYRHIHFEAYVLFNKDYAAKIAEFAKENNITMSLDLSSFEVVRALSAFLPEFLREYIDIVFANEDETKEIGDIEDIKKACEITILMKGKEGAHIFYDYGNGEHVQKAHKEKRIVDKIGAGDHFAGGFLYGYLMGLSPEEASETGTLLATHCIENKGAHMPCNVWEEILTKVKK